MISTIYVFYKNDFPFKFSLTDNYEYHELFFNSFIQTFAKNFPALKCRLACRADFSYTLSPCVRLWFVFLIFITNI
jgi:hypothetical protein